MTDQQRRGEKLRAWLKVQQGRADECVAPTAVRRHAAEVQAELDQLRAVATVMARDLALLYAAGHGESPGLKAYRVIHEKRVLRAKAA